MFDSVIECFELDYIFKVLLKKFVKLFLKDFMIYLCNFLFVYLRNCGSLLWNVEELILWIFNFFRVRLVGCVGFWMVDVIVEVVDFIRFVFFLR